jgi:hypothetical protein
VSGLVFLEWALRGFAGLGEIFGRDMCKILWDDLGCYHGFCTASELVDRDDRRQPSQTCLLN